MNPVDVLVVGAGAAGMRAAIAVHDLGLKSAVISKISALHGGCTCSGIYSFCLTLGYFGAEDTPEQFAADTVKGGAGINQPDLVNRLAFDGAQGLVDLAAMGMPWERQDDGRYALGQLPGHRFPRAAHVDRRTGKTMAMTLHRHARKLGIPVLSYTMALSLLLYYGRVVGVVVLDVRTGEIRPWLARSVILATGGSAQMYAFNTNPTDVTGDGIALAYQAGAELIDTEFYQMYPTVFITPPGAVGVELTTGQLIPRGAKLVNRDGKEFFAKYADVPITQATRDQLARAIGLEIRNGGGTDRGGVYLDATGLSASEIGAADSRYLRDLGIDVTTQPYEVAPGAHFMLGGVRIDPCGRASVPGLFAAGETTGGVHGANRLAGNALTETIVFGRVAGQAAAAFAREQQHLPNECAMADQVVKQEQRVAALLQTEDPSRGVAVSNLRRQMQKCMQTLAGVVRSEQSLQQARQTIEVIRHQTRELLLHDRSRSYNLELMEAIELDFLLTNCQLLLAAALRRHETRGAHNRLDFPNRDSAWSCSQILWHEDDRLRVRTHHHQEGGMAPWPQP